MIKKKKILLVTAIALIMAVILSAFFVNAYNRITFLEEKIAEENISKWNRIYFMANQMERMGVTEETLEELRLYNNGIIYSVSYDLSPLFNGSGKAHNFLPGYYDSLANDLVVRAENYSADEMEKGLSLYSEMNKELISLCEKILKSAEDKKGKLDLIDSESELYEETEKEISEFCNKYADKISFFYDEVYR